MKRRFITKYELVDERSGDYHIWGTCEKWVSEAKRAGYKLVKTSKILWIGTPPPCFACDLGRHY